MSGKFYPIDFMLILTDWSVMISDTAYHKKTPSNQFISFCFLLDAIIFISEHLPDNCMIYWCREAIIQLYHTYSQHHTIPRLNCIPFFCVKFQSHDVKFSFFIVHVLCYQTLCYFYSQTISSNLRQFNTSSLKIFTNSILNKFILS